MRSTAKHHPQGPVPTVGPASPEPQPLREAPVVEGSPDPALPRVSSLTLQEVERRHILRVMEEVSFQVEAAASLLGIPRSTLYVKLKGYGIQTSRIQNLRPESGI
jgi:DNA-binding NtrC family response regulator